VDIKLREYFVVDVVASRVTYNTSWPMHCTAYVMT